MNAGQRTTDATRARRKRAELAGSVGAGALGMGLGVVLASYLRGTGVLLVVAGTALHASGMWDKHRLERSAGERALWWETVFYWSCWAILGGLLVYLAVQFARR
jgi:hypothetical protein